MMSAPYWGVLPPKKAKGAYGPQHPRNSFMPYDRVEDSKSPGSTYWPGTTDRFSIQSDAPTFSTLSPTPSELPGGGLTPRPPSFQFGTKEYDHEFIEKRRQRRSRYFDQPRENSSPLLAPAATSDGKAEYSQSQISSHNNVKRSEYQGIGRPKSIKRLEGAPSLISSNQAKSGGDSKIEMKSPKHSRRISSTKKPETIQRLDLPIGTSLNGDNDVIKQTLLSQKPDLPSDLEFAPDRSPLQRLEITLDNMTKEEKRARAAEVEVELGTKKVDDVLDSGKLESKAEKNLLQYGKNSKRGQVQGSTCDQRGSVEISNFSFSFFNEKVSLQPLTQLPYNLSKNNEKLSNVNSNFHANSLKSGKLADTDTTAENTTLNNSSVHEKSESKKPSSESGFHFDSAKELEASTAGPIKDVSSTSHPLMLIDKELPSLPHASAKKDLYLEFSPQITNSKPVRGTLTKLSRLATERFSSKSVKTDPKSPTENYRSDSDVAKTPVSWDVPSATSQSKISADVENYRYSEKSAGKNENPQKKSETGPPRRLDEGKKGGVAQLSGTYLDLDLSNPKTDIGKDRPWWGSVKPNRRNSSVQRKAEAYDGEYDDNSAPTRFKPPLFLRCGPMLRYCGLRREVPRNRTVNIYQEREIWRGTVMIVCQDSHSSYELAPTLRLFLQPVDLLPPPTSQSDALGLAPEYVDPIAGISRIGRDGRTLYVRPVEEIDLERDLSREESADGLYEMNRTQPDETSESKSASQKSQYDGEKVGKYKEVRGFRLHAEQGMTFWRFNLEIELRETQQRIAYRINRGPATGFWVPPRGKAMNIMYHGCNSFNRHVNPDQVCGPDPMWRDVLNSHQIKPYHVMLGGGNQINCDDVIHISPLFQAWSDIRESNHKEQHPFTSKLQQELEAFFLNRYCMWFSQGLYGLAVSQIPMVNLYADHDLVDGFGSHDDQYMRSPVFSGLGAVAFKYYMLFQHQSSIDEGEDTEPSWILGERPGPYIAEFSRNIFTRFGRTIAFLGLDCRTEKTSDEIMSPETTNKIFARLQKEVVRGDTKHLLVLMAIPHPHMRPSWFDKRNSLRIMQPIKDLGRKGSLKRRSINGAEGVQDDAIDSWTTRNIREGRKRLIQLLQGLAAAKSVRITILGGDVNMGAIGLLYSNPKFGIPKDNDFRYMPNVISSAMANFPISDSFADLINKKNKVHRIDAETDEDVVPLFIHDVNGKPQNNQCFLNHRNWCSISEYETMSGLSWKSLDEELISVLPRRSRSLIRRLSSSHGSRKSSTVASATISARGRSNVSRPPLSNPQFFNDGNGKDIPGSTPLSREGFSSLDKQPSRQRTLSLTRKDFNPIKIFRRSTSRRRSVGSELTGYEKGPENFSYIESKAQDSNCGPENDDTCHSPSLPKPIRISQEKATALEETRSPNLKNGIISIENSSDQPAVLNGFTEKQVDKDQNLHNSNLEGSLDICLNMEINPKDPSGTKKMNGGF